MASLKEIKGRINSVKSTQKITSAMKMIASAKLHKAQNQVERFLPYERKLMAILNEYISSETEYTTPLAERRENPKRVALVVITSNSTLCGAFNSNIISKFVKAYKELTANGIETVAYAIGKKIDEGIRRHHPEIPLVNGLNALIDKPDFEASRSLADTLIEEFLAKNIDEVYLIYNHFKSTAVQVPTMELVLPLSLEVEKDEAEEASSTTEFYDYIVEPSKSELLDTLLPKSLRTKLHSVILDSAAAEHAARMVAMQVATDNADELLNELSIQYNKQRQQAITTELLDIVGGSEALK